MKKLTKLLFFIAMTLLVINPTVVGAQGEPLPSSFWGNITVNGENVPDGTAVSAWINESKQFEANTQTYQGASVYSMNVPNGADGDTITFQVDGVTANETATWQEGTNIQLNLTVSNDSGPTPPEANFTCNPTSGAAPLAVTCSDTSTGNITGWSWDLGDGSTSTDQNPAAHTYSANGNYAVSLTVTGPDGSDSHSLSITVSDVEDNVVIPLTSAGDLAVEWARVIFPQTSLAAEDVLAYAIDETWIISDTTQLGAGWHVTIIANDHLRGQGDPTNRVINVGTSEKFKVSCVDGEISKVNPDSIGLPNCPTGTQAVPLSGESPLTILSAEANNGRGSYSFVPHFELLVPGTAIIDTYTTNIFVDAIAGP